MAKSRSKIQQIGFWDPEVAELTHDQICLWAHKHADQIIRNAFPQYFGVPWHDSDIDHNRANWTDQSLQGARAFMQSNPKPDIRVVARLLDEPLIRRTGYRDSIEQIVGYADLIIYTEQARVVPKYRTANGDEEAQDFSIRWDRYGSPSLLVEAKTVLPTIGELMRQLKLYRTAFARNLAVCSPDNSYEEILADQGFLYIKYDPART